MNNSWKVILPTQLVSQHIWKMVKGMEICENLLILLATQEQPNDCIFSTSHGVILSVGVILFHLSCYTISTAN